MVQADDHGYGEPSRSQQPRRMAERSEVTHRLQVLAPAQGEAMRTRAERRHHEERIKAKVATFFEVRCLPEVTPKIVGRRAHTRKPCSCHMCGSPRHHFAEPTMQEKRAPDA
jgi:hypothetical protein